MSEQPEALRLADEIAAQNAVTPRQQSLLAGASDELRRMHAEVEASRAKPWEKCKHHGPAHPSEWACPACLRELRAEVDALRADAERSNVYIRELCRGLDAALDFAGTVGGGASWWVDVWQEHDAAIDAARGQA